MALLLIANSRMLLLVNNRTVTVLKMPGRDIVATSCSGRLMQVGPSHWKGSSRLYLSCLVLHKLNK